jgi:ribosomal protein L16 Arg81 hydroxylase
MDDSILGPDSFSIDEEKEVRESSPGVQSSRRPSDLTTEIMRLVNTSMLNFQSSWSELSNSFRGFVDDTPQDSWGALEFDPSTDLEKVDEGNHENSNDEIRQDPTSETRDRRRYFAQSKAKNCRQ